jgi:hypothetical protein
MKKILYMLSFSMFLGMMSCNNETETKSEEQPRIERKGELYELDIDNSQIRWFGDYIKDGKLDHSHQGVVRFSSGSLGLERGSILWGEFDVDLTSMYELEPQSGEETNKLIKHLQSEDFFYTSKYPTAKVTITSMEKDIVKGNVLVRDAEMPFEAQLTMHMNQGTMNLTGMFDVDFAPLKLSGFDGSSEYVSSKVKIRMNLVLNKK